MSQRIVVLGASGFIGRRVFEALAATDWAHPIPAGRGGQHTVAAAREEYICVDGTDTTAVRQALSGAAGVVNCIAGDEQVIVASARALSEASRNLAPSFRIVHLSSMAAYGSVSGLVEESTRLLGNLGPYSAAKAEAEAIISEAPDVVILRPGIVYGPQSPWWSDRIARLLVTGRLGILERDGNGLCNLVYVNDVAKAVVRAFERAGIERQAFNLAAPQPPTWNEYFSQYACALRASPLRPMPRTRLNVELNVLGPALKLLEIAARLAHCRGCDRWPPIRPWLLTLCRHKIALDTGRAERVLGIAWTPLEQGLRSAAEWFLAGGRT